MLLVEPDANAVRAGLFNNVGDPAGAVLSALEVNLSLGESLPTDGVGARVHMQPDGGTKLMA